MDFQSPRNSENEQPRNIVVQLNQCCDFPCKITSNCKIRYVFVWLAKQNYFKRQIK